MKTRAPYKLALPVLLLLVACATDYKKSYKEAYELNANDDVESLKLALEKFNDALRYAIMATDGKANTLKALGIKLLQAEMYLEAADYLEKAALIEPSDANIHYYRGLCYANYAKITANAGERSEYITRAEEAYQSGINTDPENTILLYALGVLNGFVKGDARTGLNYLDEVLKRSPKDINTIFAVANLNYQLGNRDLAKEYYRQICSLTDHNSPRWIKARENIDQIEHEQLRGGAREQTR